MPLQYMMPLDNKQPLISGDPAPDANALIRAVNALGATYNVLNAAYAGGADPTGVADSTAAVQAAVNALPATGGTIYIPPGTYKGASTVTVASKSVYIRGGGRWATTWNYTGSGDAFRIYNTDTTGALTGGGVLDLTIDGASAGAGACGLHYGDMRAGELRLAVWNFSGAGSMGVHFDNQYSWMEECHGYIWAQNCTQHVVFDVSGNNTSTQSFGYSDFMMEILAKDNQDGVVLQNGALLYNSRLLLRANFKGTASPQSSAVIRLTGQIPAGHPASGTYSRIKSCRLDVQAETGTANGTNQPATIAFGSAGNNTITRCMGLMDFTWGTGVFASAVNSAGGFQFEGLVFGDNLLFRAPPPDYFTQQSLTSGESTIPRFNVGQAAILVSGTMALTYFTAQKTETINNIIGTSNNTLAGATPTYCAMGFYSVATNGDLTLVGQCASDTTLFAATFTQYTRAVTASFIKIAGQRYAFGVLVVSGAAMPNLFGYNGTMVMAAFAPRICGAVPGQSSLPGSVAAGSVSGASQMHFGAVTP